jgi:hypothetical protein
MATAGPGTSAGSSITSTGTARRFIPNPTAPCTAEVKATTRRARSRGVTVVDAGSRAASDRARGCPYAEASRPAGSDDGSRAPGDSRRACGPGSPVSCAGGDASARRIGDRTSPNTAPAPTIAHPLSHTVAYRFNNIDGTGVPSHRRDGQVHPQGPSFRPSRNAQVPVSAQAIHAHPCCRANRWVPIVIPRACSSAGLGTGRDRSHAEASRLTRRSSGSRPRLGRTDLGQAEPTGVEGSVSTPQSARRRRKPRICPAP